MMTTAGDGGGLTTRGGGPTSVKFCEVGELVFWEGNGGRNIIPEL